MMDNICTICKKINIGEFKTCADCRIKSRDRKRLIAKEKKQQIADATVSCDCSKTFTSLRALATHKRHCGLKDERLTNIKNVAIERGDEVISD
jgi:hypothetical protein